MKSRIKKIILLLTVSILIIWLSFILFAKKTNNIQTEIINSSPQVQEEPKIAENNEQPEEIESAEEKPKPQIPDKFLINIPFYSQTPLGKWDAFHEEMCEEASVLNATYYLLGKKPSKEEHEAELQKMKRAEEKEIGEWKSTTIAQMKKFVDIYFEGKIKSKIIESPLIGQIEAEVAAGNPVIVPLSGRDIGNPNFTPPGPVYHMVVVKGYDSQNFITNDVGTRKGESYTYKKEVIKKNIHDWNETDIHKGEKKVLVLYK